MCTYVTYLHDDVPASTVRLYIYTCPVPTVLYSPSAEGTQRKVEVTVKTHDTELVLFHDCAAAPSAVPCPATCSLGSFFMLPAVLGADAGLLSIGNNVTVEMGKQSRLAVSNHEWTIFAMPGTFRMIDGERATRIQSAFELCPNNEYPPAHTAKTSVCPCRLGRVDPGPFEPTQRPSRTTWPSRTGTKPAPPCLRIPVPCSHCV